MLLSSVNDMLDLKLIEQNKFLPKLEVFEPKSTFEFIEAMFKPQLQTQNCSLNIEFDQDEGQVSELLRPDKSCLSLRMPLPDKLIGDQIRLKQIIINIIKSMVKS